ncbi:MAG: protein translocase SEC61 complex subunit gamma [Candidatus Parvarchaeota archaeon]|nr:protein translocase SEC61 complex subunit gamma [Candidatus Parvarchaeum tengchongense]MCW1299640.1 protein translocase SEC61 complex subunit gamma [Candidatus Parvarchaeum tengchongense]MCW1312269.1 protein translocase SEC61 complex subunit gamma [Candidatus Parvarchaeum tengchongense]
MDENKSLADANLNDSDKQQETVKSDANPAENVQNNEKTVQPVTPNNNQSNAQNLGQNNNQKKPAETVVQSNVNNSRKEEKQQVKKRRFHLYHVKNAIKKAHPMNIKAKLEHYRFEYSRILHLARKPTKQEFKELSIMVIIGTFIIGVLGFIIQMIIQVI